MNGVIEVLERLNDRPATFERERTLFAVGAQNAFLDRRMPIGDAAKIADLLPQGLRRY